MSIKKVIIDWFTEPDNKTFCLIKAGMGASFLTLCTSALVQVYGGHTLDYASFGLGFSSVAGVGGVGLYFKKDTPTK
jgi:hypothetical protein